ncbi:MAG TPA: hypothetical protein VI753_08220 [Anaerolineales bacterium]|nr:hypothetical protein [Anaerolineales bacterium]
MKGDALYWFLARALDWLVWGGELLNRENLPEEYPVVFVSNHATALGPIGVTSALPVRVYPWVISDMVDWSQAAEYLRKDFVEPQLHVPLSLSMTVSRLISQASVRLLRAVECIPVWQGERLRETYHISVDRLVQGKSILIFPEDPKQKMNELFRMTPFQKGFTRLGEMYYEKTENILRFYPLAVHPIARKIKVGKPISYNPYNHPIKERIRIKRVLESTIHDLYLNIILEDHAGIPLPR